MGSAFSSKTIFSFVGAMDSAFALVIFIFGLRTLVLYQEYSSWDSTVPHNGNASTGDPNATSADPYAIFKNGGRNYVFYASIAGSIGSLIQIIAAYLLITKSKYCKNKQGPDIHPGPVAKIWMMHSAIQFLLHLAVSLGPTIAYKKFVTDPLPIQSSMTEFFSYSLVSATFKFFFIWAVATTLNAPKVIIREPSITKDSQAEASTATVEKSRDEEKY